MQKSMSLKYEPSSEPLHISAKGADLEGVDAFPQLSLPGERHHLLHQLHLLRSRGLSLTVLYVPLTVLYVPLTVLYVPLTVIIGKGLARDPFWGRVLERNAQRRMSHTPIDPTSPLLERLGFSVHC